MIAQSHIDRRRFLALVASWSCLPVLGARAAGTGIERLSIIVGGTAGSNTDRTIRAFGTLAQNLLPGTRIDVEDQGGTNGMQALNNLFSASPDTPTLAVLEAAQIYAILEPSFLQEPRRCLGEDPGVSFNGIQWDSMGVVRAPCEVPKMLVFHSKAGLR